MIYRFDILGGMKTSSYFRSILLALVSSFLVQTASAEIVGEAIFPPFQLPSSDKSVTGIRNSFRRKRDR